ncbi:MAG: hypothetical protein NC452_05270 [Eubacterium sp.]|nr:hypothetical protein [Eubacterium sp.]
MADEFISRAEHKEFADRIDAENTRQNHRIERLENTIEKINHLATATEKLATNMEAMLKEQEKQSRQISALESKDGQKWREIVKIVGTAIITTAIAALAVMIGLH